jgi:hypothetical protein
VIPWDNFFKDKFRASILAAQELEIASKEILFAIYQVYFYNAK